MMLQSTLFNKLKALIDKGSLAHALLFHSIVDAGQFELAKAIAEQLLLTEQTFHPDCLRLDSDKIGVDEIRHVQSFVLGTPYQANCRVVLINRIEKMTVQASNALLKILEEPPLNRYFLLSTEHLSQLATTVLSRCQKIYCVPSVDLQSFDQSAQVLLASILSMRQDPGSIDSYLLNLKKERDQNLLSTLQWIVLNILKIKLASRHFPDFEVNRQELKALADLFDIEQLFLYYEKINEQKRTAVFRLDALLMTLKSIYQQ